MPSSRNHQRALDSMQASLEAESKGKAEAMRVKKKLEQDINELEVALDQANRGKAELEKTAKKLQQSLKVSGWPLLVLLLLCFWI